VGDAPIGSIGKRHTGGALSICRWFAELMDIQEQQLQLEVIQKP